MDIKGGNSKREVEKIKVFEAFAGYGGASFGFKKAGISYEVVGYSEFDRFASEIFELNHPNIKNYGDITQIQAEDLPDFDMFTAGFPCQPFSTAGKGLGEQDIRGTLFYDIIRICKEKKPKFLLLENVKGLTTKRHQETFATILAELRKLGYSLDYHILNSKDYNNAQNRERLWIFGYLGELPDDFSIVPEANYPKRHIREFLDVRPDENLYLRKDQIIRLIEKCNVDLNINIPLCLDVYNKKVKHDGVCITITEPHHNTLRIVEPPRKGEYIVRKLSIPEHYRLMGFEDGEFNFGNFSYQQLCKRAGNGWDVNLVSLILQKIFSQI